ncbi:hypothetical protein CMI42_04595 [Candidatus Pacearchaeota archaeon]|nr:hypothetical protein [Candidatus Pacearchaeota archaeon]
MKKEKLLLVLSLLLILSISFVSAQPTIKEIQGGIETFVTETINSIASVLGPILGVESDDQYIFAKLIFFFVIYAISFMSLKNIDAFALNKRIIFILSLSVAALSIRYLPKVTDIKLLDALLINYSVLGMFVIVVGPLLIFFAFNHSVFSSGWVRFITWLLFLSFYIFDWYLRYAIPITHKKGDWFADTPDIAFWFYVGAIIFILLNMAFDHWIHRQFDELKHAKAKKSIYDVKLAHIEHAISAARKAEDPNTALINRLEKQRESILDKYA